MSQPQNHFDAAKLDAYLDGVLPDEERQAMSREIAANSRLQAEVMLQNRIDQSLRLTFAPSALPDEFLAKLRESAPVASTANRSSRRWKQLIAAATAAAIVWGIIGWEFLGRQPSAPTYRPDLPLASVYKSTVDSGFRPTWVCKDDHEFASTFQTRQGQALLLAAMPEGTKMEGLTYCGGISRYTTTMLARVHGAPVMVFVDRSDADTHPSLPPAESKLHLFRKELGPLVMYELTPLASASVMDYLKLTDDAPKE